MGQKAISVSSVNKNLTKAEKKIRQDVETTFAAIDKTLQPPEYFTADQKKIFNELVVSDKTVIKFGSDHV